jgi:cell division protein ZapA (FtsZ GTPase activity inhibitor)
VAVLAALNIADDYYQLRRKFEGIESEYTSRAGHLGRALDSALDEALSETRRTG